MNRNDMADLFRIIQAQCKVHGAQIFFSDLGEVIVAYDPHEAGTSISPAQLAELVANGLSQRPAATDERRNRRVQAAAKPIIGTPQTPAGYESLRSILNRAFDQAAFGKGAERHADQKPFDEQPMQRLCDAYGVGFALGQAGKKAEESQRLAHDAQVRELLGAIVYLAGAILHLERRKAANDNSGLRAAK